MKQTRPTKIKEIKREWHLIDIKDEILGRTATEIALLLMGKSKANFVRNLDCGDYVVVINASLFKTTGNKEKQKSYYRHSGYPGGFKEETLGHLKQRKPENVIMYSVSGMLPDNRLKAKMMSRLFVFPEATHTYGDKFKNKTENLKLKTGEKAEVKEDVK